MGSDMSGIWFADGNMMHVELQGVSLRKAVLPKADLSRSYFSNVNLSDAGLEHVNFRASTLINVNFSNARMIRTNLENVTIQGGVFNETFFEPINAESLMILDAKGLSTITFSDPRPVVTLRKTLKESACGEKRGG